MAFGTLARTHTRTRQLQFIAIGQSSPLLAIATKGKDGSTIVFNVFSPGHRTPLPQHQFWVVHGIGVGAGQQEMQTQTKQKTTQSAYSMYHPDPFPPMHQAHYVSYLYAVSPLLFAASQLSKCFCPSQQSSLAQFVFIRSQCEHL